MKSSTDRASAYGNGGSLPSGWHIRHLGAVASEVISRNTELKMGREHVLSVDNEKGLVPSTRKLGDDFSRYKLITSGQFAYNPMRLNVGSIALKQNGTPALVSPDYIVFRCCDDYLDPDFLDFYRGTQAWKASIAMSGQGSIRVRYYFHHIAAFPMALPPLREQQAISGVLRTVQAAREACERVIAATRQLKYSLLAHLFTYGPVPFDKTRNVELIRTEAGDFPSNWDIVRLSDVASAQSGGTPSRRHPEYFGGGIPWVKTLDLNGGVVRSTEESLTDAGLQSIRGRLRPANTVMVAMYGGAGTVGKIGVLGITAATNQAICAIQCDTRRLDFLFLFYYLSYRRTAWMREAVGTRKDPNISKGIIENCRIPLPSLSVQREIAACLSAVDVELTAAEARRDALAALFASLLENLMTGRIRLPEFAG